MKLFLALLVIVGLAVFGEAAALRRVKRCGVPRRVALTARDLADIPSDAEWDKLKKIIATSLHVDEELVMKDSLLIDDLGMDDSTLAEMITAIEGEFEIKIPDEEAQRFLFPKNILEYICKKIGCTAN